MTLTTLDIGGHQFQSYATLDEAAAYVAGDPGLFATWQSLDDTDRSRRLVAATRRIDELTFLGEPTSSTQTTAWPRTGLAYADGTPIPDDEIPDAIEQATIILAASLVVDLSAGASSSSAQGVRSRRIGVRSTSYWYRSRRDERGARWGGVTRLLSLWLAGRVSSSGVPVWSNQDQDSEFTEDKYGVEEGIA